MRNPASVLDELQRRVSTPQKPTGDNRSRQQMETALTKKANERARILTLYRRGSIDDQMLEAQLAEIGAEEAELKRALGLVPPVSKQEITVEPVSINSLMQRLREALDAGLTWESRRRLIEILVGEIRVVTHSAEPGRKRGEVLVTYRFNEPVATCTGIRASNNWCIERIYPSEKPKAS